MKLSQNGKRAVELLILLLVIFGTVVTMLYPKELGYKYSLKDVGVKKSQLEALNNDVVRNEKVIADKITERETTFNSAEEATEIADGIRSKLLKDDLVYNIPSVLITLEQGAFERELTFVVEYAMIKTHEAVNENTSQENPNRPSKDNKNPSQAIPKPPSEENVEPSVETPVENITITEGSTTPQSPVTPADGESAIGVVEEPSGVISSTAPDVALASDVVPQISGIGVVTIPIKLIGTYADIRSYVEFLDELDFIEPSFIDLYSSGENVSAVILLHVFHGEVLN